MIGSTISHYKILEKLGEGGMGVVYKAEDTTLNRTVALKFLPARAADTESSKSRFLQEARAAAVLNHPNICTIYAIEEVDGQYFIAMEYIEGCTLREKLPLKNLNQAYDAAIQIADALAEAHSRGIVHRDVKSENIMITPRGQIKVMDFGLAKLKGSLKLTRTSSTVGTLGYMSPEQIQGGEVDTRSDLFSLGVVIFEMIAGELPFRGEHEAAIVYSIVNESPRPITEYAKDVPLALEEIFAKVFEKDPADRYQSAADLAVDLKRLRKQSATLSKSHPSIPAVRVTKELPHDPRVAEHPPSSRGRSKGNPPVSIIVGILLVLALSYIAYRELSASNVKELRRMTFTRLTEQAGAEVHPDISPDASYIVYTKLWGDSSDLFLQRIGGGNPINLTAGSGVLNSQPAYSPKGDLIAFRSERDGGGIFLMGSTGESVRRLTDVGFNPAWSPDGNMIVFATEAVDHPYSRGSISKLSTVDVKDGKTVLLYHGDAVQPQWSPDGKWIAFWGLPIGTGQRELWTIPAKGGEAIRLTEDSYIDWYPVWSFDGRSLYFLSDRSGTMNSWKIPIDPLSGHAAGSPEPVMLPSQHITGLRVSHDGEKTIFVSSDRRANIYRISFDPAAQKISGSPSPVTEGSKEFDYLTVSPDGRWLACSLVGIQEDIGILGTDGKGFRKLTNDKFKDRGPMFSPDGKRLTFYSERGGKYQIWIENVDGSGIEQLTNYSGGIIALPVWNPDGRVLYYQADTAGQFLDLSRPTGQRKITSLPPYPGAVAFGGTSFTSDGKYFAGALTQGDGLTKGIVVYAIGDSSYRSIVDYGERPFWLKDNRTLLFLDKGKLKLVDVETKRVTTLDGSPRIAPETGFTISPDNRTIYFVKAETESDVWQAIVE